MLAIFGGERASSSLVDTRPLALAGLIEILPRKFGDDRGFFSETWNRRALLDTGIDLDFVQDNHSLSAARGVVRGMHFQVPPVAQDKLVRVSRGAIFDVAVDLRRDSPHFGKWAGLVVSAERWNQLLIPKGFAHGFVTLEENTEVQYKVTAPYSADHERSFRFDDAQIGIEWPVEGALQLSEKDSSAPKFADTELPDRW